MKRLAGLFRRVAAVALVLALVVMFMPADVLAGYFEYTRTDGTILSYEAGEQAEAKVTVGDINNENPDGDHNYALKLQTHNGGKIDAQAGNLSGGVNTLIVSAISDGNTTVEAGNISGATNDALNLSARTNGEAKVQTGDITGTDSGIRMLLDEGGKGTIKTGNINGGSKGIMLTYGDDETIGTADITVNGNIEGESGIIIYAQKGTSDISVTGDITASNGPGIMVGSTAYGGTTDIRVEGTVDGSLTGVELTPASNAENITITAWAIKPVNIETGNGTKKAVAATFSDTALVYGENEEAFEKERINYIIKLNPEAVEGATWNAENEEGTQIESNVSTAKETDNIYIKVTLEDGYELLGAFNGLNKEERLTLKDAEGNYYIQVPKGGGIYLSIAVNKKKVNPVDPVDPIKVETVILSPQQTLTESSSNNTENGASLCASIAQMILNAAPCETVTVFIPTGTSLCKKAVDALEARKDVTLVVNYGFNNGIYSATIPANTDLTQYKNAVGGIDFETLTANFNGKPIC